MSEGLTIEEMRLSPNARKAAQLVLKNHPEVVFTSGRRDLKDQARAMAHNVFLYGCEWLVQTYRNQDMVKALTDWMEENLDQTHSAKALSEGFYNTLMTQQAGQFAQFPHCRGDAFDIRCPRFESGAINESAVSAIRRTIEHLPIELGLQLVLTKEGQHRVIHAQFAHSVEA